MKKWKREVYSKGFNKPRRLFFVLRKNVGLGAVLGAFMV